MIKYDTKIWIRNMLDIERFSTKTQYNTVNHSCYLLLLTAPQGWHG